MVQRERGSFPFRHCIFLTRHTHQRGLPPGGTERDEMQPRTEWIINVKISFPTESNKLPMIWLSERLVGRIRETPGSRGGMSSPPRVIDSCAVSTFLVVVIKGARARHGARSLAPSGRVTGPHRKPILGDLCPEHRAVVNPPAQWSGKYWSLYWCGTVDAESYRRAGWTGVFFFLLLTFASNAFLPCLLTLPVCMQLVTGSLGFKDNWLIWKKDISWVWVQ